MLRPLITLAALTLSEGLLAAEGCFTEGDTVELTGVIAERHAAVDSDLKESRVYLLRTREPVCVDSVSSDKVQVLSAREPALYGALGLVSGAMVSIKGQILGSNSAPPVASKVAVQLAEAVDLEAAGGPAPIQPLIPLGVTFRKAIISNGMVMRLTNNSQQPLVVSMDVFRPATDRKLSNDLVFNPGQSREIGEREGWAFISGDQVTITKKGYKKISFTPPT